QRFQLNSLQQTLQQARHFIFLLDSPQCSHPPAQPMLAFDEILADLETKLLQQYRLLQGILTYIVK
ncbi:MAG: hypothetical protein EZS28_026560, partial [Streblomastix strix]